MEILIEGVRYTYPGGPLAVDGVTATLAAPQRVGLLGCNGSGKSTLARLMNGLLLPSQGCVTVAGLRTLDHPASRLAGTVGYLFQDPRRQLFCRTVADEVAFGPRQLGWDSSRIERALDQALLWAELEPYRSAHPYELPSRWMRRVGWASVLAMEPRFLIADEPTARIDAREYGWLLGTLQLLRERGTGVIVITHDVDFAAEHMDRLLVLESGRLAAEGTPAEVFARALVPGLRPPVAGRAAQALGFSQDRCTADLLIAGLQARGS